MKYLLDSHALLWFLDDPSRLSPRATDVIVNPDNALFFSVAGYWEICIKISIGRLSLLADWDGTIRRHMTENQIQWLPIHPDHARAVADLPFHHRDPFDRMLIAQSRVEQITILSRDSAFAAYDVAVLW